jgi:hypothetical protein
MSPNFNACICGHWTLREEKWGHSLSSSYHQTNRSEDCLIQDSNLTSGPRKCEKKDKCLSTNCWPLWQWWDQKIKAKSAFPVFRVCWKCWISIPSIFSQFQFDFNAGILWTLATCGKMRPLLISLLSLTKHTKVGHISSAEKIETHLNLKSIFCLFKKPDLD